MTHEATTDYPVQDQIRNRYSPRAFAERSVPEEVVRSLLEAARWAPSCFNEQPWQFLVAQREDKAEFARLLSCLNEANQRWAQNAGVLMVSVAAENFARNQKTNRHAWHDVGQAAAQLTLEAMKQGLFVHQMAGFSSEQTRSLYEIPEGFEPVAAFAIGYAGDPEHLPEDLQAKEKAPRKRKPQREFVFAGKWNNPL